MFLAHTPCLLIPRSWSYVGRITDPPPQVAVCKAPPAPDALLTGSWWSFTGTQLRLMRKSGCNLQQVQCFGLITMYSLIQFFQSIDYGLEAFAFFPWITKGETATLVARFSCLFVSLALGFVMVPLLYCGLYQVIRNSTVVTQWLWKSDILIIRAHMVNGHRGRMWGGDWKELRSTQE